VIATRSVSKARRYRREIAAQRRERALPSPRRCEHQRSGQRQRGEPHEHHDSLEEVRPGDGHEATGKGVGDDDSESDDRAHVVLPAEKAAEGLAGGIDPRAHVDGHEERERSCGDEAQRSRRAFVPRAPEPAREVVRNRDRVESVRSGLEGSRHEEPGDGDPDDLAHHHPEGACADQRAEARQSEVEPRRLAAGACREGDDPVAMRFPPT
jgi:hypothetical protein